MPKGPAALHSPPLRRVLVGFVLLAPAVVIGLLTAAGPFRMDPVAMWGGVGLGHHPGRIGGFPNIEPNMGSTSFALGFRAALELFSGRLPLWNHFEGLGSPLLGEMQCAALFPFTWLLLLPYGQAIEHAALQAVAGVGTYLFLRRFGLRITAALAGAVLFEFNGVFAWLRNAIYNPVAFLPWLFYAVEALFDLARRGADLRERGRPVCVGAIAAGFALYAGFPEVVYFYSWLLAAWVVVRASALSARRALAFGADLVLLAVLALLIAAPLLLAFGHFLTEAAVGGHQGDGFRLHFLPGAAFLLTMLPYAFGSVAGDGGEAPRIAAIWGDIGGYLGLIPLFLAVAGALCTWRARTSWVLAGFIVLAVGASHGVPVLHGIVTALPLATIAAYSRYLDAAWIFAAVVLAAVFVDRVDGLEPVWRRRVVMGALAVVAGLLGVGLFVAAPILADLFGRPGMQRRVAFGSIGGAAVGALLVLVAFRLRRPAALLGGLAALEAVAWFVVPFYSIPKFSGIDRPLIEFLQRNAGLQRFAIGSGGGLGPNFGSVFGIPAMNYDDLPVPARTARFVTTRLDATNDGVIFGHNAPIADSAERRAAAARFRAAAPGYRAAGVRYVLSDDDGDSTPAFGLAAGSQGAVALGAGATVTVEVERVDVPRTVVALSVLIGTFFGASNGVVEVRVCQAGRCAAGAAPLAGAPDNRGLLIRLDAPIALEAGLPVTLAIGKVGGQRDVALWARPVAGGVRVEGMGKLPGYGPVVDWIGPNSLTPVLRTATTSVFELEGYRPYFTAEGCRLVVGDQDRVRAWCDAPSRLLRLEVFMRGWRAAVNGVAAGIEPVEETFQGVALPAGESAVVFTYAPAGVRPAVPVALLVLVGCLVVIVLPGSRPG